MNELAGYVLTGIVSLAVGLLLQELRPKVKLVFWVPHTFWFQIPLPEGSDTASAALLTHAITIQNVGRKSAEGVEIVLRTKPDFFKLQPAMDYTESTTPAGEHLIRVKSLGPREFFTVEFLSYASHPAPLSIRSTAGLGREIPVQTNQSYSPWLGRFSWLFLLSGIGLWIYWLARVAVFVVMGAFH
ncbi:MAG: hypothetical protein ABSG46_19050 [Candidatus Binataceae bacterium]|jgi:hypothetical protein